MPVLLVLALAIAAGWAWKTGRFANWTPEDGIAAAIFLLGLRMAMTGKIVIGLPMIAGAAIWWVYRRNRSKSGMALADARALLGVSQDASLAEIRSAHRRLIAKVHPDMGGSAELANRVNVARDVLIADMARRVPRKR